MRLWGARAISIAPVVAAVVSLAAPRAAHAQPSDDITRAVPDDTLEPPPPRVGYGALPGGVHALTAETLPQGTAEVALLSGYGYRKGLLAADHTFTREIGDVAVAYAPLANLVLALSLDGRHDKHTGFNEGFGKTSDDSYVGDPHLLIRGGLPLGPLGRISVGGQVGIWAPGNNVPSVVASAISVDARALLSIDAGFGTISADAGFRVDNSAKSATNAGSLLLDDRISLGVSQFSAALAGLSVRFPATGRAYGELEGSADVFVGSGAPGPILRAAGVAGVALNDTFSLIGFVELARVPSISASDVAMNTVVLIPYEPTVTGGLGLQARFGGPRRTSPALGQIVKNIRPIPVIVVETADVSGIVFDDAGKPIVGARVTVTLKNNTGTAVTDGRGAYSIAKLPIGKTVDGKTELDDTGAEVAVELINKKPGSATLTLAKGANAVPPITLESILPPGELRGRIINAATSRPIAGATVAIDPGGATQTSGPDGKFTVDLPPGHYTITVNARGLAQQQLDVVIEQNGVAIKNIELHK